MSADLPRRLNALMLASVLLSPSELAVQAGHAHGFAGDARRAPAFRRGITPEAPQLQPEGLEARIALVRSLIAWGNSSRAQTEIALLLNQAPDVAVVHVLSGMHEVSVSNVKGARAAYERALALSPGLFEAVSGLTYLDLRARDTASAISRLDAEIAKQPTNASLLVLLARAYNAASDSAKEEEALRRAVTVDPRFTIGYSMLARLYREGQRIDQALAEFEGIAERDASNLPAHTMVGILLAEQGKRDEAIKAYERIVDGEKAAEAANNIAFSYAEQGTNLDLALQLAIAAKQRMPDNPIVDDTIGWVYYKQDLPALAVKPLESAVKRLPNHAELLVHLGLTYAKLGDKVKARETLQRALKLDPRVVGGDVARRVLASLSQQ
jgi:tetratricopeptide (TPR) repeat protein